MKRLRTDPDRPIRVLLIDDDEDDFSLTRANLSEIKGSRFILDWVKTYEEGLETSLREAYDVILLDYRLGEKNGLDLLRELQEKGCLSPVILLTGQSEWEVDIAAMEAGAADFLDKNRLDATLLERSIRYALQERQASLQLERKVQERTRELEASNAALQQEILERKRAEEALRDADRRKDEFLGTLAHELRNPLAPMRNALEIMRISAGNPAAVDRARPMMERQVSQLVRLINDLLDVSRVTRDKLKLQIEPLDLNDAIDSALEMSLPLIQHAGLTFEKKLARQPIIVQADQIRLAQILSNLLNNAAKYTPSGGRVELRVEPEADAVRIHIQDTGAGIPAEMMPQIFELFTQVNRSLNRSQGGLGIGLALVKRLVEMHHGTVTVKSAGLHQGAEFIVRLPAKTM